jgi:hypothetical protein
MEYSQRFNNFLHKIFFFDEFFCENLNILWKIILIGVEAVKVLW